jgi:hypothetical protein
MDRSKIRQFRCLGASGGNEAPLRLRSLYEAPEEETHTSGRKAVTRSGTSKFGTSAFRLEP